LLSGSSSLCVPLLFMSLVLCYCIASCICLHCHDWGPSLAASLVLHSPTCFDHVLGLSSFHLATPSALTTCFLRTFLLPVSCVLGVAGAAFSSHSLLAVKQSFHQSFHLDFWVLLLAYV
jgi:hypothetical protein